MSCDFKGSWRNAAVFTSPVAAEFWAQKPLNSRSNIYFIFSAWQATGNVAINSGQLEGPESNYFKAKISVQRRWNEKENPFFWCTCPCSADTTCPCEILVLVHHLFCFTAGSVIVDSCNKDWINLLCIVQGEFCSEMTPMNRTEKTLGWIRMKRSDDANVSVFQSWNTFWSHFLQRRHRFIPRLSPSIWCFAVQLKICANRLFCKYDYWPKGSCRLRNARCTRSPRGLIWDLHRGKPSLSHRLHPQSHPRRLTASFFHCSSALENCSQLIRQ